MTRNTLRITHIRLRSVFSEEIIQISQSDPDADIGLAWATFVTRLIATGFVRSERDVKDLYRWAFGEDSFTHFAAVYRLSPEAFRSLVREVD